MKRTLFLATMMAAGSWAATTYTFTGSTYPLGVPGPGVGGIANFTSCVVGPCASFTTAMRVSGSFTVAAALPANFGPSNIIAQVTSYSFSNGITTFTNTNPNSRIGSFVVATDGTGNISVASGDIYLQLWLTGSSPHSPGDRAADMDVGPGLSGSFTPTTNNQACSTVGTAGSGVTDTCTFFSARDSSTSFASNNGGSWTIGPGGGPGGPGAPAPTGVPALGEWGVILLGFLLAVVAWLRLRRQGGPTLAA
jgi:hypothetical protein